MYSKKRNKLSAVEIGRAHLIWILDIDLSEYEADDFITKAALAQMLSRPKRSINRMVTRGDLPLPWQMFGMKVWRVGTLADWLAAMSERDCEALSTSIKELQLFIAKQLKY